MIIIFIFVLTNGQVITLGKSSEMEIDKDRDIIIKITYYE